MIDNVLERVGATPIVKLFYPDLSNINIYSKLEFSNPTGSVKDRAASYILDKLLNEKKINYDTEIIESSSGNFAISLSSYCKYKNLKFTCVIDPVINPINETIIKNLGANIIKVQERDKCGGYLQTRLKVINEILKEKDNIYWVNQYASPYNVEAYYKTLGEEICNEVENIDYVFLGVSSGGTITGVSKKVKERFPDAKVIAVDIIGSVIFGGEAKTRYIPGIGSSIVPHNISNAKIDDVVMVNEVETIEMCHDLLNRHCIMAGGSSGSVIAGIKKYFLKNCIKPNANVVTIFPDRGDRYADTIYNCDWCESFLQKNNISRVELCYI